MTMPIQTLVLALLLPGLALAAEDPAPGAAAESPISGARQLTFEGRRAGEGYFSADGERLIFQSERVEGNPFYQIFTLDLTTGDVTRVSPGIGKTTCAWFHPDGERALFASTQFDPEAEAKMRAELDFRASGETRRYAWDYDPAYELVATDLSAGSYTRLTDAEGYDAEGSYSPDGTRILFASNRHAYAADLSPEEAARLERDPSYFMDLYVMDADGANVERLTEAPGYDGGPFWSADGERITWRRFSEDGARAEVYTARPDGTDQRKITDLGVMSWAPFFHPSGEYLIFSSNLEGFANFELYIVDAAGEREPVRVTAREGFDGLPSFSPDGTRIAWTSNATPDERSQIFLADWDHEAALALLAWAPAAEKRGEAPALPATGPEIAAGDLRAHVDILASAAMEGRLTGTEGAWRAGDHVARAFERIGLRPAGDDGSMVQGFEFTAGVALGEDNALRLGGGAGDPEPLAPEDWTPLAFSATGAAPEAGVAFAGYGIVAPAGGDAPALDSYGGLDVSGKWVLIWRGMPSGLAPEARTALSRYAALRYKASVAKSRGAAGVIFANPPREGVEDALPRLTYEASMGAASLPAVAVARDVASDLLAALGDGRDALLERIEAGEGVARDLEGARAAARIALEFETREGRNILARLELDGRDEGGLAPLVIGAHLDHLGRGETSGSLARGDEAGKIHHGADDNASGVAAVIEAAEWLAARAAAGELDAARDIVFAAWSGEELGLLGASHFAEATAQDAGAEDLSDLVSAYINLDMVGRLSDRLIVSGLGSSPVWAREVERRNAVIGLPIVTSEDSYQPTDSTAFYLAGVPVLALFTGAHEDYHRPSDTAEKLNYEGLADIARFTALVARSRAMAEAEPEYLETARPEGEGGRRMSNVFLGTIPDYASEGRKGVPISGVVTEGPAEAAGLEGGDVIVELAGQPLDDIYDYVRTLNGLVPGETVSITVERGGARRSFEITPASRN